MRGYTVHATADAPHRRLIIAMFAFVLVAGVVGLVVGLTISQKSGSPTGNAPPLPVTTSGRPGPIVISTSPGTGSAACAPITAANAPKADPAAVARILAVPYRAGIRPWSTGELNYIALVDQAARADDFARLSALAGCRTNAAHADQQAALWRQPGVLPGLVTVLEKTHAAPTDGLTFPGFLLSEMTGPYDVADLQAVGGISADGHSHFVSTSFRLESGTGGRNFGWDGVQVRAPARPAKLTAQISEVPAPGVRVGASTLFTVELTNFTGHDYRDVAPALAVIYGGPSAGDRQFTGVIERWDPGSSAWTRDPFPYPPLAAPLAVPSSGVDLPAGATATFTFRITVTATPDARQGALLTLDIARIPERTAVGSLQVDLPIS